MFLAACAVLAALGARASGALWYRSHFVVARVEQLCPGGPRAYRLVSGRDSLALVVGGVQRFAVGETVEVIR